MTKKHAFLFYIYIAKSENHAKLYNDLQFFLIFSHTRNGTGDFVAMGGRRKYRFCNRFSSDEAK